MTAKRPIFGPFFGGVDGFSGEGRLHLAHPNSGQAK